MPERRARPRYSRHDRPYRYTQHVRAFLIAQPLDRCQVKHGAVMLGQRGKASRNLAEPRVMFLRRVRMGNLCLCKAVVPPCFGRLAPGSRNKDIVDDRQRKLALVARRVLADYAEAEDLLTIGAYSRYLA